MKVIIAGSRNIEDYSFVCDAVRASGFHITEVVSGRCRGVDFLGERWAEENSVPVKPFEAEWTKYGPQYAGTIRNAKMAKYADALIAIWDGFSPGTETMIQLAQEKGIPYYVHRV